MSSRRFLTTLIAWMIVVGSLAAADADPQVLVLGGAVAAIVAVGALALDFGSVGGALVWAQAPQLLAASTEDADVAALAQQIRDARRPSSDLRDALVTLANDRLLHLRGIEEEGERTRALVAIGPALQSLISSADARFPNLEALHQLLDEIEAI